MLFKSCFFFAPYLSAIISIPLSAMLKKPRPNFISPVHPGALQKNRKRSYIALENPGRLSTGYNGLGGHSTVLMPSQARKIKKVAKPRSVSKFVRTKTNPALPQM